MMTDLNADGKRKRRSRLYCIFEHNFATVVAIKWKPEKLCLTEVWNFRFISFRFALLSPIFYQKVISWVLV